MKLTGWRSRPGALLSALAIGVAAVALALPYAGPVARLFGFPPLPPALLAVSLGIVALYLAATEGAKACLASARGSSAPARARRAA